MSFRSLVPTFFALVSIACVPPGDADTDDTGDACNGSAVVTLDDVADVSEGATWEEDGVTLTLLASDQGAFNANHEPSTGCLWLFIGTTLRAETTCGVAYAEIDTIDYCGGGCVQARAYEAGTEVASASSTAGSDPQTLFLEAPAIDQVDVSGLETPVCEIRLEP